MLSVFQNNVHPRWFAITWRKLIFVAFPASVSCTRFAESLNVVFPGVNQILVRLQVRNGLLLYVREISIKSNDFGSFLISLNAVQLTSVDTLDKRLATQIQSRLLKQAFASKKTKWDEKLVRVSFAFSCITLNSISKFHSRMMWLRCDMYRRVQEIMKYSFDPKITSTRCFSHSFHVNKIGPQYTRWGLLQTCADINEVCKDSGSPRGNPAEFGSWLDQGILIFGDWISWKILVRTGTDVVSFVLWTRPGSNRPCSENFDFTS